MRLLIDALPVPKDERILVGFGNSEDAAVYRLTDDRAIILDFGFAQERARAASRRPGAPPDGGTPNYMAPERLRSGRASIEDDLYALALTPREM